MESEQRVREKDEVTESTEQVEDEDRYELDTAAGDTGEELSAADEASHEAEDDVDSFPHTVQSAPERMAIIEALIYVADEPLSAKSIAEVLKEDIGVIEEAGSRLAKEFNERASGLHLREVAGGWQFSTRPEYHEHVRAFLKSRPSAKLSLASLETLAVIAYKQPITVPEILDIRGVQSPSSIKTLLDKKLIVAKGRKETVGRPMMYGTSKEFLIQFGLKDLSELPSIEDFEDLAGGVV